MAIVYIFTDGACSGNPGPGGWGAILVYGQHRKELYGYEAHTTNNRMELRAVIAGLMALKQPSRLKIVTDSKYVLQGITLWMPQWRQRNWKTANKKPVKNQDLWEKLDALLTQQIAVEWEWVKGHAGHPENERADELARYAITVKMNGTLIAGSDLE